MRDEVLHTARELVRRNLVEGTAGNVSARMPDGSVCITPSGVGYDAMTADDLVVVDIDGRSLQGSRTPSTEMRLHLACYRAFADVGAVVHSHPVYATMFAVARRPIPACIDEFSLYVGGEVPVADYALSGTAELGDAAVAVLGDRGAALLANHGVVAVGPTPAHALHVAALVERAAQVIWGSSLLAEPVALPAEAGESLAGEYMRSRARAAED